MRPARLLRRGFCLLHKRGNQQQAGPGERTTLQKYDEEKYGGWKSAAMLFSDDQPRKSLIGRADWHVVQFLLALIPPGMLLLLLQWARYDMRQLEERTQQEMLEKESRKMAAVAQHQKLKREAGQGSAGASAEAAGVGEDVEQRLARLEALVQALQQARHEGGNTKAGQHPADFAQRGEQQTGGQQGEDGGQAAAVAGEVQQTAASAAVEVQQADQAGGPSLAEQMAGALRWAGSWLTLPSHQQQQQQQPAESASAASTGQQDGADSEQAEASKPGSSDTGGNSGSSSNQDASAVQGNSAADAQPAAARGSAASSSSREAASEVPAPTAHPPGNTANWLLHAAGWPLRLLRTKPARSNAEVAEEEQRLRSWLQHKPEESD